MDPFLTYWALACGFAFYKLGVLHARFPDGSLRDEFNNAAVSLIYGFSFPAWVIAWIFKAMMPKKRREG